MGNLVNPTVLRLKNNIYWNSSWVSYININYSYLLSYDYFLFFYINWFIKQLILKKINWIFLISHYKILRYNNNIIIIFFYKDYKIKKFLRFFWTFFFQKKIVSNFFSKKKIILIKNYFFLLSNLNYYFKKNNLNYFFFIDYSLSYVNNIFISFFNYNYLLFLKNISIILFLRIILFIYYYIILLFFFIKNYLLFYKINNFIKNINLKILFLLNKFISKIFFIFINLNFYNFYNLLFNYKNYLVYFYCRLLLFLRLYWYSLYSLFFLIVSNKIFNKNNNFIKNKYLKLLNIYYFYYNYLNFFFLNLKKKIFLNLKYKFIFYFNSIYYNKNNICIYFYDIVNVHYFTSKLLLIKIINNLKKGKTINQAIYPIINKLYNNNLITGFKILCSGRFQRKGRARKQWIRKGKVALSTSILNVDYASSIVKLRNGICSVKIFMLYINKFNYNF
jgi:Ribosomal protein S3, C-terminal domain